jgi:serine/threonine protein kinase
LKPGNILLTTPGSHGDFVAKVADFGNSRYGGAGDGDLSMTSNAGTPAYTAPEVAGDSPESRCDNKCGVYSFGITAWAYVHRREPLKDMKMSMFAL